MKETTSGPGGLDRLVQLLLRPEDFFETLRTKYETSSVLGVRQSPGMDGALFSLVWIVGIARSIDRLDLNFFFARLPEANAALPTPTPWPTLWASFLAKGLVAGILVWFLWGWWFRVRLRWSGAADPEPLMARATYVWACSVWAVPTILWTGVLTMRYADYRTYLLSNEGPPWAVTLCVFWSIFVGYRGALTLFDVETARARVWFLVLPSVCYGAFLLGGVALVTL